MDNSFFKYLEQLEAMAFFSGFPLVYAIIGSLNRKTNPGDKRRPIKIFFLLPYAYAFVGVLYLGLQLKNLYPDYSLENMNMVMQSSWLKIWALLALLFWIPALAKRPVLCLLHSLVFFYFLGRDLFIDIIHHNGKDFVRNDMKIYTSSLLVNLAALTFIVFMSFLFSRIRKDRISRTH